MPVEKLGDILPYCKIKIIDAPVDIQEEKERLEKEGYKNLWVFHVYGKEPLF